MERIVLKARAKINWTLDVIRKRSDGYHEIETVMQSVDLWDRVVLDKTYEGIHLQIDTNGIPRDSRNIAWKAAAAIKEKFGVDKGVIIKINKNIPISAGLAGGSADGAAVLVGLNSLWNLKMSEDEMRIIAKDLGADVPFCIQGGTALAQGIGEKLTTFKFIRTIWLVICKPPVLVSTAEIFSRWDNQFVFPEKRPSSERMIDALVEGNVESVGAGMGNVLEVVTTSIHPEIVELKHRLIQLGAFASLMSGSGPSVYGVFENRTKAEQAADVLKDSGIRAYAVCTSDKGIELMEES